MDVDKFQGIYEAYGRADVATIAMPNTAKFDTTDGQLGARSSAMAHRPREGVKALLGLVAVGLSFVNYAVKDLWRGR